MRQFDVGRLAVFVSLAIVASVSSTALGQYDFTFALGYSHIELDNPQSLLFGRDGPYFDADFAFHPAPKSPLTIGGGITGSGHFDSEDVPFRFSPTTVGTATLYSDVGFFELEPRVGIELYSRSSDRTGVFLRARVGAGLLIDSYAIDHVTQNGPVTTFQTLDHTGVAFEVRPAVQVGYAWGASGAGVDLSYMAAWGDFGDFGSTAQEARVGLFYTYKF